LYFFFVVVPFLSSSSLSDNRRFLVGSSFFCPWIFVGVVFRVAMAADLFRLEVRRCADDDIFLPRTALDKAAAAAAAASAFLR